MASGATNSWANLANQAAGGELTLYDVVAYDCATYCNEAIRRVLAVRNVVDRMKPLDPFTPLESGGRLAEQLKKPHQELGESLGKHHSVLTDMAHTFITAGKIFDDTDRASARYFDKMAVPDSAGRLSGTVPTTSPLFNADMLEMSTVSESGNGVDTVLANNVQSYKYVTVPKSDMALPAMPNDVAHYGGQFQAPLEMHLAEVMAENPYSLTWQTLYKVGLSVDGSLNSLTLHATQWRWLAGELEQAIQRLTSQIGKVHTEGLWKGSAATSAVNAGTMYQQGVSRLTTAMHAMSDNLAYTNGYLARLSGYMPPLPNPPSSTLLSSQSASAQEQIQLTNARNAMAALYVPGVQASSSTIPVIPQPMSPVSGMSTAHTAGGGQPAVPSSAAELASQRAELASERVAAAPLGAELASLRAAAKIPGGSAKIPGAAAKIPADPAMTPGGAATTPGDPAMTPGDAAMPAGGAGTTPGDVGTTVPGTPVADAGMTAPSTSPGATDGLSALSQLAGVASPALSGLQQAAGLAQSGQQAAQLAGEEKAMGGKPPRLGDIAGGLKGGGAGGGGAVGLGGGAAGRIAGEAAGAPTEESALFPRASLAGGVAAEGAVAEEAALARAGAAPATPYMPGAGAGAGQGQGQQGKDHKRLRSIDSAEHLEQALGQAPLVVKPVVDK